MGSRLWRENGCEQLCVELHYMKQHILEFSYSNMISMKQYNDGTCQLSADTIALLKTSPQGRLQHLVAV